MRMFTVPALALLLLWTALPAAAIIDAPRITKEDARALIGKQGTVFLDARTGSSWEKSDRKIKGAVRIDKWDLEMWSSSYPSDTTFIVY